MAFESYYWKKNIKRDIRDIQKKMLISLDLVPDEKIDEVFSFVEIKLFMMAFSIRKLLEARKLPDAVANIEIKVIAYKRNDRRASIFFDFEKLYDFKDALKKSLKLTDVLNQFIHAYFFQAFTTAKGHFRYLYVTSDRTKNKFLYRVDLKTFLILIKKVSEMHVTRSYTNYDKKTGEFITVNS